MRVLVCFALLSLSLCSATLTWQRVTPSTAAPPGRRSAASVCYGQDLIVFGGRGASSRTNDLWRYNYDTSAWAQLPNGPMEGRSGACMWVQPTSNRLWVMGGRNDAGVGSNDVHSFELATQRWTLQAALSAGPSGGRFGMTCYQRTETDLCIYGGQVNSGAPASSDAYCFNTDSLSWTSAVFSGDFPGARNDASDVDVATSVYLIGGNGTADDRLFVLDTITSRWRHTPTAAPRPIGRGDAAMGVINGVLFLQGGREGETGRLVEGSTWTLSGGVWTSRATTQPPARWGMSGCTLPQTPGTFVMFGGVNTGAPTNEMWYLSDDGATPSSAPTAPTTPAVTTTTAPTIPAATTAAASNNTNGIAIAALVLACIGVVLIVVVLVVVAKAKPVASVSRSAPGTNHDFDGNGVNL